MGGLISVTLKIAMTQTNTYFTKIAGVFVIVAAMIILLNYYIDSPQLNRVLFFDQVRFNAAICFLLSGFNLFLINSPETEKWRAKMAGVFAIIILLISGITLSEYLFSWNAGIDQLFHRAKDSEPTAAYPGRMKPASTILFLFLALLFLSLRKKRFRLICQVILYTGIIALGIGFISVAALNTLPHEWLFASIFLHVTFIFLLIFLGILFSHPLRNLKFSFEKKIAAYFFLVVVFMSMIFLFVKRVNTSAEDVSEKIGVSREILLENHYVQIRFQRLEISVMAFITTGNSSFLGQIKTDISEIESAINKLKKITDSASVQRSNVDSLAGLVNQILKQTKLAIEMRESKLPGSADMRSDKNVMQEMEMAQLGNFISKIDGTESQLLTKRKSERSKNFHELSALINLFYCILVLLLFISFVVIYRNTRARNRAESKIKDLNANLEKRVEEKANELLEKENQYRFLIENMREGIQVIGFDWRYILVNNSMVQQCKNTSEEDLLGYTLMEKFPGIENTEMFNVLEHCMIERKSQVFESEYMFPDGSKSWSELSIQPVPEGLFVLSVDTSERRKSQEEKISLLETLQKSVNEIYTYNPDTLLFEYVNDAALKNLGYSEEEIYRLSAIDLKPMQTRDSFRDLLMPLNIGKKEKIVYEFIHQRKDGSRYPAESHIQLTRRGDRAVYLAVVLDITERKRSELITRQLNIDLEKRAAELTASNSELERFAFVASHDLQEPLRMVSSFLTLLKKKLGDNIDPVNKKYIDFAVDGADRMKKLIHDLLEYSRTVNKTEAFEMVDCNNIMVNVRKLFALSIIESQATLVVNSLPVIQAVQTEIQQLFQNIVGNALKYHNDTPLKIEVGCFEEGEFWKFYIKDNGLGIDPKYFEKIFIIFQRLHNKSEYSGTGIGLSVCKKIVNRHCGQIWVTSEIGKGSTFYFTIQKI